MLRNTYSNVDLEKFILEITENETALEIFKQLQKDGGNTIQGLIKNLNDNGIKIAKTKAYEEIGELIKKGILKRVSKRPAVYSIDLADETLEELSKQYFMDTREEIMRKWAVLYPFLPNYIRQNSNENSVIQGLPLTNFNTYPIIDVFQNDKEGLERFFLRVFESNEIYISNTIVDTCLSSTNFLNFVQSDRYSTLSEMLKKNYEKHGKIVLKTLSTVFTNKMFELKRSNSLSSINFPLLNFFEYEIRRPLDDISSFVLTENNIHFPIGTGVPDQQTNIFIEIREASILKSARIAFNKVWNTAETVFKVENGEIIKLDK